MNLNVLSSFKLHIFHSSFSIKIPTFQAFQTTSSLRELAGHAQPGQVTAVIQELRLELERPMEALAILAWPRHGKWVEYHP
jgi:hypothetical protein